MRKIFFLVFLLLVSCKLYAQDTEPIVLELEQGHYRYLSVVGGYAANFGGESDPVNHLLEVGISLSNDYKFHHPANVNYHFTTEVMLRNDVIIGPKIGAYWGAWMFTIGADVILYSDFKEHSLRLSPNFGFGGGIGKIYVGANIPITNKNFQYLELGKAGIIFSLHKFSNKNIE